MQQQDQDNLRFSGHIRPAFTHIDSRSNSLDWTSQSLFQLRARLNADYRISPSLQFRARLVGKVSSDTNSFEFWYHPYAPSRSGLTNGKATFDMFLLQWDVNNRLSIQAGRMQHAFQLRGLIPKSFDRYHSQNLASTWSNGIWARWSAFDSWDVHFIAQYNHLKGSGSAFSSPLNFENPASRISYFAAFESTDNTGFWRQRGFGVSMVPGSITRNGEDRDYYLFSGRAGILLPADFQWTDITLHAELSYAPIVPDNAQFNLMEDTPANSGALGWQASLNFEKLFERQALSVLYGYAQPGMLLAPSFRNNTDTWEVRYQFRFTSKVSTEVRYRIRNQEFVPDGAASARLDRDLYVRLTIRI